MNPTNPFGSPQGGAFQAPSNPLKSNLFQSFSQQTNSNQPQAMGFFPSTSAFGQPSVMNQPPSHGSTIFGHTPAFGQSSTQPSSLPPSQTPAFGQPAVGISGTGFGSAPAPAFGQSSGRSQSSVFGQTSSFGQPSAFGQAPGFGQQPPSFGQPSSGFGSTQVSSGSTPGLGQPQPLSFGQPVFGQTSSISTSTSVFGSAQSVTQSGGFGPTEFSFKPDNEVLFKPIFSASPEPTNPQTTSMSSSSFGNIGAQTSSSTTSSSSRPAQAFSQLTGAQSGPLGFSFSQPAAAPSFSAQNNPLTTSNSSSSSSTLQFTFSQPAAPSSSSTKTATTQPTTPSSFSFAAKTIRPQEAPLFGESGFGQQSAFDDTKEERGTEDKGSNLESLGSTNVFARLGKGTKRKEDPPVPSSGQEKSTTEEDAPADAGSPRQPSKRPLMRSRGPTAGIFGRALSGIRRDVSSSVRQEAPKEMERENVHVQGEDLPVTATTRTREILEKAEESGEETNQRHFVTYAINE